jgi:uncharacterized membrane protein YGL010W
MNTTPNAHASAPQETDHANVPERRIDALLHHYGLSHVHPTNEIIHMVAIPAIMLSLTGLMFALHPAIALVFFAASMVYYARLSWRFTGCMLLVSSVMLAVVDALDARGVLVPVSVLVFVVAWIFQFIGHRIEGKKPSFFEDIQYLWVGPLFVLSKGFLRLGVHW